MEECDELQDKITLQFEKFKEKYICSDQINVNQLLYNLNKDLDMLMYNVKFEIHEYFKTQLKGNDNSLLDNNSSVINATKMECLTKLQTLGSMITCHIVKDFKDKSNDSSVSTK